MRLKSIFTNSFGILLSRIFGFLRDVVMASALGASYWSDIFFLANRLPNLFRNIFAEGAFTQAFMPSFVASANKSVFSTAIFLRFSLFIIFGSLVVTFAPEYITKLQAMGWSSERIADTAPLTAINFWYLYLIFIVTFIATLLQYKEHFITTAMSSVLLNLSMITTLLLSKDLPPSQIVYNLSFGVVIGGVLQLLVHLVAIKIYKLDKLFKVGFALLKRKKNKISNDIKRFNKGFIASIIGGSTAQLSAFIDSILASFLVAGSISHLFYANRLFQFPLAIFAIATSTAIFPKIAKHIKQNNQTKAINLLKKSTWFLLFSLSFATIVGIVFSKEIVYIILQRGAFSINDTTITSQTLTMFLCGLLPFGLAKIFSLWLYSNHKQAQAAKISAIALVSNIIFSLILISPLKVEGLALSSSLSGLVLFILTIKYFGIKNFLDILWYKRYIFIYILFIIFTIILTLSIKGFLSAYIQL